MKRKLLHPPAQRTVVHAPQQDISSPASPLGIPTPAGLLCSNWRECSQQITPGQMTLCLCRTTAYCSEECRTHDQEIHQLNCPAILTASTLPSLSSPTPGP